MQLKVLDSVYEPREDSYLMQKQVQSRAKGKIVLDMGTGSGIQAISASLAGAKEVWSVDVNPKAIECAKANAKKNKAKVQCIQSDLFQNVPKMKFDLLIFNPPYLPSDGKHDDIRWSGGFQGIEVTMEFIKQTKSFLARDAEILFIFSSHANQVGLKEFLKLEGFELEIVASQRIFFEEIFIGLATLKG
jgi:release factor glutamine methyltransferase